MTTQAIGLTSEAAQQPGGTQDQIDNLAFRGLLCTEIPVIFWLVVAKSTIGRGNPNLIKATQTPKEASFFVSASSAAIPSGLHDPLFMVALVGQSSDWSVSLIADISTPANATAPKRGNLGGSSMRLIKEAAVMATIPTPKVFTFLITPSSCRLVELPSIRTITAVAENEAQARSLLAGLPLVFLSRTPAGRVAA